MHGRIRVRGAPCSYCKRLKLASFGHGMLSFDGMDHGVQGQILPYSENMYPPKFHPI